MKVEFSREEIVTREYSMSLDNFMKKAFREAQIDIWEGHTYLRVGIPSGTNSGYLNIVYTIKLLDSEINLDFDDKANVKSVIARHLKGE